MKKSYFLSVAFAVTTFVFGQEFENFNNSPLNASYTTGNFIGSNNVSWNFVKSRDANGDANASGIVLPAIMLWKESEGSLLSALSGINGIGEITMKLYKGFTSTTFRQVDLYVNGVYYATSTGFNDNMEHVFTTIINQTGNILIEIKNTKSVQIIVDDVQWSAYGTTLSVVKNQIENFSMYPNPVTKGELFISSATNNTKKVTIYSIIGQRVYDKKIQFKETIDISNLITGIYIVKVEEDGKIVSRKLVIN